MLRLCHLGWERSEPVFLNGRYDQEVSDCVWPACSGISLLARMRTFPFPRIATSLEFGDDHQELIEKGANGSESLSRRTRFSPSLLHFGQPKSVTQSNNDCSFSFFHLCLAQCGENSANPSRSSQIFE
jgi:hypothetical protein